MSKTFRRDTLEHDEFVTAKRDARARKDARRSARVADYEASYQVLHGWTFEVDNVSYD